MMMLGTARISTYKCLRRRRRRRRRSIAVRKDSINNRDFARVRAHAHEHAHAHTHCTRGAHSLNVMFVINYAHESVCVCVCASLQVFANVQHDAVSTNNMQHTTGPRPCICVCVYANHIISVSEEPNQARQRDVKSILRLYYMLFFFFLVRLFRVRAACF